MTSIEQPMTRKQRRAERKRAKIMAGNHGRMPASLSDALTGDGSLPLDDLAKEYWFVDVFTNSLCRRCPAGF